MGYSPNIMVAPCPGCGARPKVHTRIIRFAAQLRCKCGIAGQWVQLRDVTDNPWNAASRGWDVIAGRIMPRFRTPRKD